MSVKKSNLLVWLGLLVIILTYLATRVLYIGSTLEFFNDMGRDFWVLQNWKESYKPPLLGPQTSAVSFNQSPVYFYLLFPLFILTGGSAFASFYTATLVYLGLLVTVFYWAYKKKQLSEVLIWLTVGILVCAHPETWRQTQFIWNPTFVLPFMLVSLWALGELWRRPLQLSWTNRHLWLWAGGATLATACSYSTLPVVLAQVLLILWNWKKDSWHFWLSAAATGLLWYLPFIAFELRHRFALTWLLIHGQRLPQARLSILEKLLDLSRYILGITDWRVGVLAVAVLAFLILRSLSQRIPSQSRDSLPENQNLLPLYSSLLALSLLFTLLLPVGIESHYIFGLCAVFFMTVTWLEWRARWLFVLFLLLFWLQSNVIKARFQPARRTVAELEACAAQICAKVGLQPIYVSMESGLIAYHNAPEHRFFLRQAGCNVLDIEGDTNLSNTMVAITDSATYDHGKTAYEELTRFGPSNEVGRVVCSQKLGGVVLRKVGK